MAEICTLSFAVEPLSDDEAIRSVLPIVNGVRFTTLVEDFERAHRYNPAGSYAGLVPDHFNFGPLDEYFMARATSYFVENRRYYLLGCQCGEVGCWPLEAHIGITDGQVCWEDFRQPFREERDYSFFGPFRFDLDQYRQAVSEMVSAVRSNDDV